MLFSFWNMGIFSLIAVALAPPNAAYVAECWLENPVRFARLMSFFVFFRGEFARFCTLDLNVELPAIIETKFHPIG